MGATRAGTPNLPRARALAQLERKFPELKDGLLSRMAEQAEKGRAELEAREAAIAEAKVKGEEPPAGVDPVTLADRNLVGSMYERVTKYLLPALKATEVKMGGLEEGGAITVKFERDPQ